MNSDPDLDQCYLSQCSLDLYSLDQCSRDSYLLDLIHAAQEYIKTEGITLSGSDPGDVMLVEMYAAYLYRERRNTGDASKMPRMLRWALNNRLFSQKISEG